MNRILSVCLLTLTLSSQASANTLLLIDTDCKVLKNGESTAATNIEVMDADKSVSRCTKRSRSLICAEQTASTALIGDTQEYDVLLEGADLLIAQSKTGNTKIVADLQAGRYYYGLVYFSPGKGAMYTKNCTGIVRKLGIPPGTVVPIPK